MKNIKKYLNDNEIKFEDKNDGFYSPYVRFILNNEIYVVTDYGNVYEITTIDREFVIESKTQKSIIEQIKEVA
ncbi:hypothetical protein [Mammaliicoccus lentus]|uniref:Uncharacterized protein n=1 Tax=Mammaliicoccus lentus TaxID=42858 RepID=A0ABS6GW56_MAMLE|nr:hypothetical protein [Mammaliicoccus lentus]MBU6112566.1 hypothetical protein [Mammaliicoccus lentus]